jgi:hypothetical protein
MKTAKLFGSAIRPALLARAHEVASAARVALARSGVVIAQRIVPRDFRFSRPATSFIIGLPTSKSTLPPS